MFELDAAMNIVSARAAKVQNMCCSHVWLERLDLWDEHLRLSLERLDLSSNHRHQRHCAFARASAARSNGSTAKS